MTQVVRRGTAQPAGWPGVIGMTDPDEEPSVYDHYPELFSAAFPELDRERRRALAVAGRSYASAIFTVDHLLDGDRPDIAWTAPLRVTAHLHDAYTRLAGLFGAESPFWQDIRRCLSAYMDAMATEASFVSSERPLCTWDVDEAIALARGKCAVAELVPLAMAHLAGDPHRAAPLVASVAHYNAACTLLDDLLDWRADLGTGRPNYALAVTARSGRGRGPSGNGPDAVGRRLYFGGPALDVLDAADLQLDRAADAVATVTVPAWLAVLDRTRRRIATMRSQLLGAADDHTRSHGGLRLSVQLPRARTGWEELATTAGRWLIGEGLRGFPEGRHLMRFPHAAGFTGATEVTVGDVFTHAVATEALCDLRDHGTRGLEPLLAVLREHLLVRRRPDEVGMWSYFPDLPELPPDADDLAEVLRVLLRTGGVEPLEPRLRRCLEGLLAQGEGVAFPTWIVGGAHAAQTERQQHFVATAWGTGCDLEVVANLADALLAFDAGAFAEPVTAAKRWLADRQSPDGGWAAEWYHGGAWATWAVVRLLAPDPVHRPTVRRAVQGLLARQRDDGGWSNAANGPSAVFDTALTALTLDLAAGCLHPADAAAVDAGVCRALRSVRSAQRPDGSFASEPVIRMDLARAAGGGGATVSHGSATLVTAVVVRAATALSRRSAGGPVR
jgi:squalene-hopene/tetraprenyl-beta-curcumene cyclase